MMLPMWVLGMGLVVQPVSAHCKGCLATQTDVVRNALGVSVSLRMQSDDDHSKELHWCASEYELRIVRADGRATETGWSNGNDAEWDRAMEFRVEGFSGDSQRAVALVREGGKDPMVEVLVFGLGEESVDLGQSYSLSGSFLRHLGAACIATLRLKGLTQDGYFVLATLHEGGCSRQAGWKITGRVDKRGASVVEMLRPGAAVDALQTGKSAEAIDSTHFKVPNAFEW